MMISFRSVRKKKAAMRALKQMASLTVYSSHDEANLCGIRGASEMCVDLFGLVLVQAHEAVEDVVASGTIVIAALVVREVVLHRAHR